MSRVPGQKRPVFVTVIVLVNALGWLMTLGVWVYFHATGQIPSVDAGRSYWERSYIGLVKGFTVADAVWSNLTLLASIVGLWRMRAWGWTATLMANTIWVYSMTFTLVRDLYVGLTTGTVVFLVFTLFALVSTGYLWVRRSWFWQTS